MERITARESFSSSWAAGEGGSLFAEEEEDFRVKGFVVGSFVGGEHDDEDSGGG